MCFRSFLKSAPMPTFALPRYQISKMKRSKDTNEKFNKPIIDDQISSNLFKSTQVQKGYFLKTSKLMIFAHVHVFEKQSVQCFTPSNSHNTVSNSHQDLLLGRTMYNIQLLYIYHSDQMSQMSQVSRVSLCVSKVKVA